jgi:hypothetical protein
VDGSVVSYLVALLRRADHIADWHDESSTSRP